MEKARKEATEQLASKMAMLIDGNPVDFSLALGLALAAISDAKFMADGVRVDAQHFRAVGAAFNRFLEATYGEFFTTMLLETIATIPEMNRPAN